MRLLLDTHALIWAAREPARLGAAARAAIEDLGNDVLVSAASAWEVAIKRARGRLAFPPVSPVMLAHFRFAPLAIGLVHAAAVEALPPLHADPFDRVLVAQARAERLTLVTRDPAVSAYDVPVLWH